jgi:glycosyltransferase involved in cell wall biosynthesis
VIYLAYVSFILAVVQLLVAFTNLMFRQAFPVKNLAFNGLVSVLIPARNEEKNIAFVLNDLRRQDYRNIEIIVFNDLSDDKTAEIVSGLSVADSRIRLINSGGLPGGWLGKNYACHILSESAGGEYLLFLDADVRLKKDIIIKAVTAAEKFKLGLLSIFPAQIMITTGERIAVPNMNYILLSLLPLILVRKSVYPSLAAANGQFMLFNAAKYRKLSPHERVRGNKVEDIEIARYFKQKHNKIACLTGIPNIECRMYEGFREAAAGFSRNILAFFGNSFTVAFLFWLFTTFGIVAVFLTFSLPAIVLYIIILFLARVFISITSMQNVLLNLILIIPQQLAIGFIIYKALINRCRNQHQWKGRNIS